MNILNKSMMATVVATICASGMIISSGNSIADEKKQSVADSESMAVMKQQPSVIVKKKVIIETQIKGIRQSAVINDLLAPPPGPFFTERPASLSQEALNAPQEPKAPISLMRPPELRANSLHFNSSMPRISQKMTMPNVSLKKPIAPVQPSVEPKLSQVEPQIKHEVKLATHLSQIPKLEKNIPSLKVSPPVMPENSKQPDINSIERPIWMQKNTVEKSRKAPLNNQGAIGAPKIKWNNSYPVQQYIYVPVPVMPSNMVPPQMPVFNHNMIPPSSYWGVPEKPNDIQFFELRKGDSEKTTLQKGSSK